MGRLWWVTGVLLLLPVLASGCEEELSGFGNTVSYYGDYDHVVDGSGVPADGPKYLREATAEVPDSDSREEEVTFAVESLIQHGVTARPSTSYWAGRCLPGRRVESVEITGNAVAIRLAGVPRGHRGCDLSPDEREVQRQQVAWTVRANIDPFGEEEPPSVRVVEADGDVWPDVVPDPSYLELDRRPSGAP